MNLLIKSQCNTAENTEKNGISQYRAAAGAAVDAEYDLLDPDLRIVMKQWETLPIAIKTAILVLVRLGDSESG